MPKLTDLILAENDSSTQDSFALRQWWSIVMSSGGPMDQAANFRGDRFYFGKINHSGDIVWLSESNLKEVRSTRSEVIFAVDFVADAFSDLQKHMKMANLASGGLSELRKPEARKGWLSPSVAYGEFLETLYDGLVTNWFVQNVHGTCALRREHRILDMSSFVKATLELIIEGQGKLPLTKSAFIGSKYFSRLGSGLCLELSTKDHGSDNLKAAWIEDPNFQFFKAAAQNHGFALDKNAPWRLVADINHPSMKKYMEKYDVTPNNLFKKYYYRSFSKDIKELKAFFIEAWNAYATSYPAMLIPYTVGNRSNVKTKKRYLRRRKIEVGQKILIDAPFDFVKNNAPWETISDQSISQASGGFKSYEYHELYSDRYWLELYYLIRLHELRIFDNNEAFNREVKKILQVHKYLGLDKAQEYVNMLIKTTPNRLL